MIKFFINQYKAVNLLVVLIIGFGIYTFITGQKEGFPNVGLDQIIISTTYPGASADDVKKLVTDKIENEIDGIEGAERITSFSSESLSIINFEIDASVDKSNSEILDDIKSAVDTVTFNEDVEEPRIRELDFAAVMPNIAVGFIGDGDLEEIKAVAKRFKADAKKIPGVSKVNFSGYRDLQIWVEVNPQKIQLYELELASVINAIRTQNVNLPAGKIKLSGKELFIKTTKEYQTIEDIENIVIRGNDSGNYIFLRDVADVKWAYEEITSYKKSQGKQTLWLNIYKTSKGDSITITKEVKNLIEEYKTSGLLPSNISTTTADDIAFYVDRRLSVLSSNATVGLVLVLLCMVIFFNLRVTLWTMLGIPFSFCLAIIIAYGFGMTLNLMTMFGLIIVVGMIVDDAIIIAESIYSHVERGVPFYEAAIIGTKEMTIPVIAIIATTTIAFLPLVTLPGIFGDVLGIIPKIIIITLLCSLIECLFILPGHLAHIKNRSPALHENTNGGGAAKISTALPTAYPPKKNNLFTRIVMFLFRRTKQQSPVPVTQTYEATQKTPKKQRRWFIALNNSYEKLLERIVKRPIVTATSFMVILLSVAFILGRQVPFVFFPGEAESIFIDIETPSYNDLEATEAIIDSVEAELRETLRDEPDIINIVSTTGQDSTHNDVPNYQSYLGFLRVFLDVSRTKTDDELSDRLETVMQDISGISAYKITLLKGGPPAGKPVDIYVSGDQLEDIIVGSEEVYQFIKTLPNTRSHATTYEQGKDELNVTPNPLRSSALNINLTDVANSVWFAFSGTSSTTVTSLSSYSTNDDEVAIVVKYRENNEDVITDINETYVRSQSGRTIPLQNISDLQFQKSSVRLVQEDNELFISVNALLKDQKDIKYNANVLSAMIEEKIPEWESKYPTLDFSIQGEQLEQKELSAGITRALTMAFTGIYFVLTIIFRSYVQPVIVMSIIPLGFIGIVIGLFLTGTPVGLMPFLGGVALMGIVVNDSLIMVDKINKLRRKEGLPVRQAVVQGAKARMRPILMTSLTTVVGITPLAYGLIGQEPFLAPMAIALMWGLIVSTFLLLILLPAFYLIMDIALTSLYRLFNKEYSIAEKELS
ncbi:hypothetical protein COTS27_00683 [Spirochaetota bacterium]|nr:hypothetical protein COTS27_00683 [Spirochaetota bacterium]